MSDINELRSLFTQMQGNMDKFLSYASNHKEMLSDLSLNAMMEKIQILNDEIVSLSETIRLAGNDSAQQDALELFKRADEAYDNRNYETALKYYHLAAVNGYAEAQTAVGLCYLNGEGIRKDEQSAVKWLLLAGNQGEVHAQYELGRCYRDGKGVPKNKSTAEEWFEKAAGQGHVDAQYFLHICILKQVAKSHGMKILPRSGLEKPLRMGMLLHNINWVYCIVMAKGYKRTWLNPRSGL